MLGGFRAFGFPEEQLRLCASPGAPGEKYKMLGGVMFYMITHNHN
jgi:hypothetical protein